MPHKFAFVLEQTLGHVAHSRNLERSLALEPDIDATIIRLDFQPPRGIGRLPGLRTWSFRASWAARQALLRRMRSGRLDAVFIHTQVAALLAGNPITPIPTVISLDATPANFDDQGRAYGHHAQNRVFEAVKRKINQRAFGAAQTLVTWCRWSADSLERDYGVPAAKTMVVHPGVDLDLFRPDPERSRPGAVRLLFVGGNFARKGGRDLLEALRVLRGQVELDVVTGSEVEGIPPEVLCRVHRGLQPQSAELVRLYRDADVFVLPTRGDCFPQVIAEALACGLPVVATDVGGIREMVDAGVNGWLVPPESPRELAGAIASLVNDESLRRRMGQSSLNTGRREHDMLRNNRAIFAAMARLAVQPSRTAVA
ncbi:MAG TPA: glycosyltransferase family 4 protein [Candidatus Dormibacteraeota bacterium]|nr:glycosyltransferase family 4 protein [Candidatus Dormibacteraeota bacterium]